ncbi:hypothetical protein R1sor_000727 [Riccia sorocarpa]|uniref:Uncharacterized protein n=1 Tax=Riccia sorocarpa TaxID=122646 RepID=A0ABD3GX58_9MARC
MEASGGLAKVEKGEVATPTGMQQLKQLKQRATVDTMPASREVVANPQQGTDRVTQIGLRRSPEDDRYTRESRQESRERRIKSWKQAVNSPQCIVKNVDRFKRLEKGEKLVLYPEVQLQVPITEGRMEELAATFLFLQKSNQVVETKKQVKKVQIDTKQFLSRMEYLRERSFVLYTVDAAPAMEVVEEWANAVLFQEMDITVERIRRLQNLYCRIDVPENIKQEMYNLTLYYKFLSWEGSGDD